ncbi:uncharacterized protein LOC123540352 isoform X3 [Mercenaria mercenaria]|uniref:uncharacterized protein LOC123540352 isoform X3 n=1 Tax=Mercenaria mercenaria TaxID=6596 RepID=UPI00234FB126|nr:uncharacterized protein LOC123540352 isoform X3 [Mercenaria mercenaria]
MSEHETVLAVNSVNSCNSEYTGYNSLSRLIDQTIDRRNGHNSYKKKGKVSITPPTSPSSASSFSFQQNGYDNNSYEPSSPRPRLVSDSSDPGIDGHFKFLEGYSTNDVVEVFAISDGKVNNDTLSKRSTGSKPASTAGTLPGVRDSFPEDKYKWNDTEPSVNNTPKQSNKRKICFIVFITILVLALIAVGVAVILVYKVFDVGEKEVLTTVRPEILYLEGSLDLKETWTDELTNPNSSLYISTATNFILEMDKVMKNSSYSDSYIRTYVTGFSPGSIKVNFKMLHNYGFKKTGRTAPEFAELVEEHLVRTAPQTNLPIDSKTIEIHDVVPSMSSVVPPRIIATATSPLASAAAPIVTSTSLTFAAPTSRGSTVISPSASAPLLITSMVITHPTSTEQPDVSYKVKSPLTAAIKEIVTPTVLSASTAIELLSSTVIYTLESAKLPNVRYSLTSCVESSIQPSFTSAVTFPLTSTESVTSSVMSPSMSTKLPNLSSTVFFHSRYTKALTEQYTVIPASSVSAALQSKPSAFIFPSEKLPSITSDLPFSVSTITSSLVSLESLTVTNAAISHSAPAEPLFKISIDKTYLVPAHSTISSAVVRTPLENSTSLHNTLTAISPSSSMESSIIPVIALSPSVSSPTVISTVISPSISTEILTVTLTIVFPLASAEPLTVTSTILYPLSASLTVTCAAAYTSASSESPNVTPFVKYSSASTEQLVVTATVTSRYVAMATPIVTADLIPHVTSAEHLIVTSSGSSQTASAGQLSVIPSQLYNLLPVELPSAIKAIISSSVWTELPSATDTVIPSTTISDKYHSPIGESPSLKSYSASSGLPNVTDNVVSSSVSTKLHELDDSVIPYVTSNVKHQELPSVNGTFISFATSSSELLCVSDTVTPHLACSELPSVTDTVIYRLMPDPPGSVTSTVMFTSVSVDPLSVTSGQSGVTSNVISPSASTLSTSFVSAFVFPSASNTLSASETREAPNSTSSLSTLAIASSSAVPSTSQAYLTDETSAITSSSTSPPTTSTRAVATTTTSSSSSATSSTTSTTPASSLSATTSTSTTPSASTSSSSSSSTTKSTTTVPSKTTTTTTTPSTTTTSTTTTTPTSKTTPSTTTTSTTTTTPTSTTTPSTTTTSTTPSTTTTSTTLSTTTTSTTTTTPTSTTTPSTTTTSTTTSTTTTSTTPSTTTTSTTPSTTTTSTTTTTQTSSTTSSSSSSSTTSSSTTSTTSKTTTTTEPDRPPAADAGSDITITLPKRTAVLDGSASTDDHGITSYQWEKLSPASVSIVMVGADSKVLSVSDLVEGTFVFRLTVSDKAGQIDQDVVTLTVNPAPTTPTTTTSTTPQPDLCLPVDFATCSSRGFTQTIFPNFFNHESGIEAEEAFNISVEPVINQICQETAIHYMCSLYFPKCDPNTGIFAIPCKSLCEASENSCGNYFSSPFPCKHFSDTDCVALPTTTEAPTTTTMQQRTCEPTIPKACRRLGFNQTAFPNFFSEPDQENAIETFENYLLPTLGCHEDALYFVCSIQFPKCVAGVNIKPCRRTCQAVSEACEEISLFFQCGAYEDLDCVSPPQPTAEPKTIRGKCAKNEFSCGKVTKCISEDRVCNGVDDCGDWTDEMNCVCSEYEYQCDMGMCIKSYHRCDGEAQCPDNSDEKKCDGCTHGAVKCPSGECIMSEWVCDGRAECKDGWDEYNCDVCGYNQFTCADRGQTCIDLSKRCDGVQDCPEGYDEWDCINHEKGILEINYLKYHLPVCAATWHDAFGDYTCSELLGEGPYINKTDITYNLHAFANISGMGKLPSVLGPWDITYDCPGSKAVRINCQPRGCGKRKVESMTPTVVGGEDADPGEWPWHVALYFGGQYFCGGTLISDTFVLTAAHCVEKFNRDFSLMTVKLGATNRAASETTQHVIKVEAIESHSEHVYFKKNDIALLQLEGPVTFTNYIQPICLPEPDDPLPLFSTCFTVGWGKTKWDGDYAEVLQKLKMTLWDTKKCNSSIAWNGEVYDTFLCAGYYSGVRSICKGDSGGPLLCLDQQNTWRIFGVSSYVANFCNMTERPNIYTNVTHLLPWIHEKTECKFRCDNGKCLYYTDQLCDRHDHCGDNSDEVRPCNRTVTCDFEDKFLCGYEFTGWKLGYDNKFAASIEIDGQTYTQSNAPQYDHTIGRFPGNFFYGKQKNVREAELWSPRFNTTGQTCIRFSYYQRGSIKLGLFVYLHEYHRSGNYSVKIPRTYGIRSNSLDEWKTGYFDVTLGDFKLMFRTADLLSAAIDDIVMIPGMCSEVLCNDDEYRCKGRREYNHKCIAKQQHCNLAIDCDGEVDENTCSTQETHSYTCTFENGNLCALYQEVGDASDWWLVNASFVRDELGNRAFVDHSSMTVDGFLFYINANNLQTSSNHIYMWQLFYLRSKTYCFSFYYQMKSNVNFNIHVTCQGCTLKTYMAQSTFEDKWTLFQIDLPTANIVNITYDVEGTQKSAGFVRSYIALDDIVVKPGVCPEYVCPDNYTKCKSSDRCIPDSALCDRKVDCLDESDEEQCVCRSDEYRCTSGRCIPEIYKCDREAQCLDSSDEGDVCQSLMSVSCTFEHPYMCGYDFLHYTRFRWERNQGGTKTHFTGPEVDHTYHNQTGHYMYTEANNGNTGDNATFISPVFSTSLGQSVLFYYHMYSLDLKHALPGILQLSIENLQTQTNTVVWQARVSDLKDEWRDVCVDLPNYAKLRLWFTVIRNESTIYGVDMAIDDVKLNSDTCAKLTTPPPSTTTTARLTTQGSACGVGKFECNDGTCIPASYRCDTDSDCPDSSDEFNC